ncbi:2-phosphosulfolactate phosphatase [Cellulomonas sp. SLBN-39]|uniref:2-phosphosulfolactate phosphatase n=1 Tax=Cellulomonas sp. SLBN-39 TaxID=2768446 RepID=UPI0021056D88|nr:2-phosphosulfolactate phosphatase [Cellulomonas sp. SLBN-39]
MGDQVRARVRLEWGRTGAMALLGEHAPRSMAVVVDVLSFGTAVTVACEGGARVLPVPWSDPAGAERLAAATGAALARPRGDGRLSLSPASLRDLGTQRLVLPSPNGAAITHAVAGTGARVVVGCLRNASAVARAAAAHLDADPEHDVVLVPAGERWPDGGLRPALEDLLAAGAVAAVLRAHGTGLSPEALAAAALWSATPDAAAAVLASTSGRELVRTGWPQDVDVAVAVDASRVVPTVVGTDDGPEVRAG